MRTGLLFLASLLLVGGVHAQCGPYKGHPVWPDTLGWAHMNLSECGSANGNATCLWDNGSTNWFVDSLVVGTHHVVMFDYGIPYDTLEFDIEQLAWQVPLGITSLTSSGILFHSDVSLAYSCGGIFDHYDCPPVADSTVLYLLQDGIAIDSVIQVSCMGALKFWNEVPFGHTYEASLVDRSTCGSHGSSASIVAFSIGTAQFTLNVSNLNGGANDLGSGTGSIEVVEVQPGPDATLTPPLPLTGMFMLLEWPSENDLGLWQTGTGAIWEDLVPGQYEVFFNPDGLCNTVDTIVTIDAATAIGDAAGAGTDHLHIRPQPVHDVLHWNGGGNGPVRVYDQNGRVVRSAPDQGRLDVADLPAGLYELEAGQRRARFVKW